MISLSTINMVAKSGITGLIVSIFIIFIACVIFIISEFKNKNAETSLAVGFLGFIIFILSFFIFLGSMIAVIWSR
jgi:hypothetical protein